MSIVIAFHFGEYALLCADTRTIYVRGERITIDDDNAKVRPWGHGLVCGSGLTNLLEPVIWRIQNESPLSTDAHRTIITQERELERTRLALSFSSSDIDAWFATTGWLLTYNTSCNGKGIVRIAIYHPSVDATSTDPGNLRYLVESRALVIVPADPVSPTNSEAMRSLQQQASDRQRPTTDFGTIAEHYNYHVGVCRDLVRAAAESHRSVSSRMNLGIHRSDGHCELTEIMECACPARV